MPTLAGGTSCAGLVFWSDWRQRVSDAALSNVVDEEDPSRPDDPVSRRSQQEPSPIFDEGPVISVLFFARHFGPFCVFCLLEDQSGEGLLTRKAAEAGRWGAVRLAETQQARVLRVSESLSQGCSQHSRRLLPEDGEPPLPEQGPARPWLIWTIGS